MRIDVRTNFPDVARQLAKLQDGLASTVMARTLNRVVEQARTQMGREIRNEFNLTASYVRERLQVRKAFARAGQFALSAELTGGKGTKRAVNVIHFSARKGTTGVSVAIRRGTRKEIAGSFIGNKGRTVFKRRGAARLPIDPVRTIDAAQMFNTRRINAVVVAAINARLPVVFDRELRYALLQAGLTP